jgi:hypothetical protein
MAKGIYGSMIRLQYNRRFAPWQAGCKRDEEWPERGLRDFGLPAAKKSFRIKGTACSTAPRLNA